MSKISHLAFALFLCTLPLCTAFGSPVFLQQHLQNDELVRIVSDYLASCETMRDHSRRIRYYLAHLSFSNKGDIERLLTSLQEIRERLDRELPQCAEYEEVSATISNSLKFLNLALQSEPFPFRDRTVFFYFEGIAPFYREFVKEQIVSELYAVEEIFSDELGMDLGNESIVFYITDRRLMEEDIGGATIGSFIWMPIEYALGNGHKWAEGVRESTVRHEIVHAFMNHVSDIHLRYAFPEEFVEGMALYLAGNRIIEFSNDSRVRLSDDYMLYLKAFDHMEEAAGRRAVLTLIRDVLSGESAGFFEQYEQVAGSSYERVIDRRRPLFERVENVLEDKLSLSRSGQRNLIVFGTLIILLIPFLVNIPDETAEEARRNISVGFLTFIILALLTQGRIIEMAHENYIAFVLLSLFAALLLRGYPSVRLEDLLEDAKKAGTEMEDDIDEDEGPDDPA